mmetsp:Transcript_32589/g.40093  ORF Transcript_32589/g.40093 Transcript_32589/m.40093 type:complete len:246 (-) Transcript_32589:13-750(-)
MSNRLRVLVCGGGGELGRSILNKFVGANWITYATDVVTFESPKKTHKLTLNALDTPQQQYDQTKDWLQSTLKANKFDCIINTAGAFVMDKINDPNFFENLDKMWKINALPAYVTAKLAVDYIPRDKQSLVILTGAVPALNPTWNMISYGSSKAMVHHLTRSISEDDETFPESCKIIGMLPTTIATKANKDAMKNANQSHWTPINEFGEQILKWWDNVDKLEHGQLYQFDTRNGYTTVNTRNYLII